jgi:hypothetical protein
MSHIDSFKHSLVGELFGLPVYRALEDIEGNFRCKFGHLLIGGGSGEHPAMVLENPIAMVARFIDAELLSLGYSEENIARWESVYVPYLEFDNSKLLTFYEWNIDTFHSFYQRCSGGYQLHRDRMQFEDWLILGFGEFIFFSMPELCADLIKELPNPYKKFHHVRYSGIMVVPPNMPVYANGGNHFFPNQKGG